MTNTLTLRSLDIPSIHKFGIGFDSILDDLLRGTAQQVNNYPVYNIVKINDDEFAISLAVSGFGADNLKVTKEKNFLVIDGIHPTNSIDTEEVNYLHKGISSKNFRREFKLADHVEVKNVHLELGILNIHLKREVPEEQRPKTFEISYTK